MKLLKFTIIKLLLVGLVIVMSLSGGRANADFTFGTPVNLGPTVNSSSDDDRPSISPDGLSLYFTDWPNPRPGGLGGGDIWVTTRKTTSAAWGPPVNVGPPVNSSFAELHPWISADDLSLYFVSDRPDGYGSLDIWVASRATTSDPWSIPVNLGPTINTANHEADTCISSDGLELYFAASNWPGGYGGWDIWLATRPTIEDLWDEPVNLGSIINTNTNDGSPCLTADGLTLFFASRWPRGDLDIYVTTRATTSHPWGEPVNLGPDLNTSADEHYPVFSPDGLTLYFRSDRLGGFGGHDLWQAPIIPIVDFNCDGVVDSADVCIMVDHWGENYSLCDIGPTPIGDGMVDVQDLIVLAEHLFEDVNDPTLVAHWTLDEAEGGVARDNAGANDAVTFGNPLWQPTGGIVFGAIQLDGIDDCVIVGSFPNPTEWPFSVLAWVKGGAPGQVLLSQIGIANWLLADPSEGYLMTEFKCTGRSGSPMLSQTNIADGSWHRIGFIWDGSNRTLYVDGVAAAEDTQDGLEGSDNGLYIGCGRAMEPGTFWSGLIDDVRIYKRVLSAEEIVTLAR
jgi:hypothetical protein